jgi:hypothetical protein
MFPPVLDGGLIPGLPVVKPLPAVGDMVGIVLRGVDGELKLPDEPIEPAPMLLELLTGILLIMAFEPEVGMPLLPKPLDPPAGITVLLLLMPGELEPVLLVFAAVVGPPKVGRVLLLLWHPARAMVAKKAPASVSTGFLPIGLLSPVLER